MAKCEMNVIYPFVFMSTNCHELLCDNQQDFESHVFSEGSIFHVCSTYVVQTKRGRATKKTEV